MQRAIEITIPRDSKKGTTIEVIGAQGPGCKELTRNIEAALGASSDVNEKPEFLEMEQERDRERA